MIGSLYMWLQLPLLALLFLYFTKFHAAYQLISKTSASFPPEWATFQWVVDSVQFNLTVMFGMSTINKLRLFEHLQCDSLIVLCLLIWLYILAHRIPSTILWDMPSSWSFPMRSLRLREVKYSVQGLQPVSGRAMN